MRKNLPDQFSGPPGTHTGAHVDSYFSRKGYANAERAVWKLFLHLLPFSLRLPSPPFACPSLAPSLHVLTPPSPRPFHKSYARQVGSLLRNGFPDFFAAIKGFARVGADQRDLRHETGLDGSLDTREQPLFAISLAIRDFGRDSAPRARFPVVMFGGDVSKKTVRRF